MKQPIETFDKQPAEAYLIAIEWAGKLPVGAALVVGTVEATRFPDMVIDNSVIANTLASVTGTQSITKVQAGEHGRDYRITFMMTLSNARSVGRRCPDASEGAMSDGVTMKIVNIAAFGAGLLAAHKLSLRYGRSQNSSAGRNAFARRLLRNN